MDLEKYNTLMEPVTVLGLAEEVTDFLADQGVSTVMDLLDQELAYYPSEIADELRHKLEEAGLVEPSEPEQGHQSDPTRPTAVDPDTLWQAVTEDWKDHVDSSTIIDGVGLHPHESLNAQNIAVLAQRVKDLDPPRLQVYGDADLWIQALVPIALQKTRALILDTPWEDQSTQALALHGDLTPCLETMGGLDLLFCVGTFHLGAFDHFQLKHMYLQANPLTVETVVGICRSKLPSLETLALGFGAEGEASAEAMEALYIGLTTARWPKLRTLSLENLPSSEIALDHILRSPLAKQLKTIRLYDEMTDEDEALAVIESHADVFAKTKLIAPFEPFSEAGFKRLKKVLRDASAWAEVESLFLPETYLGE